MKQKTNHSQGFTILLYLWQNKKTAIISQVSWKIHVLSNIT
ncbi:hypothetical protein Pse7429DRAFT_1791 [Pseudanabaena biceps PCC 7429]|uniref:Uncharacterized protein n=1 Tax=Pseudanabaena biceps PCC 7429 TaxID=927668 RepID=L8N556_9CYAN|nr:hypothetical protein Pse7429DRAFT_1791 [Pseudanabaena biceps PCC 7429]